MESIGEGIFILEGGRIRIANSSFGRLVGYSPSDLVRCEPSDLFSPELSEALRPTFGRLAESAGPVGVREGFLIHRDGRRVAVSLVLFPLGWKRRSAWLGLCRDLSQLKDLERDKVDTGQRLQEINSEIDAAYDKLSEFSRQRLDFLATVTHELRTPITVISGYSKLLLNQTVGSLNDTQRQYIQ
ncbi:MAG: PAS domain S-box protein, partial [Vicinamibacteria bacterium]